MDQAIDDLNTDISRIIVEAAKESIPKRTGSRRQKIVPWWTQECSTAIKNRNKAFKVLKKTHNIQNLVEYKRKQAVRKGIVGGGIVNL